MSGSKTRVRVHWRRYGLSWQEQVERMLDYGNRVSRLDPLLADFSWAGRKNGYKNMLMHPNIWDMSEAQRYAMFDFDDDCDYFPFGFWNRRTEKNEVLVHDVTFYKIATILNSQSQMVAGDIPAPLLTDELLTRWLEIAITAFDADNAEIATFEQTDDKLYTPLWRLWLKNGEPWPEPTSYLEAVQVQPYTDEKPWLGGTLYTWPEFAPWDLLNERSILTRDVPA
jgi:hypothetical protein